MKFPKRKNVIYSKNADLLHSAVSISFTFIKNKNDIKMCRVNKYPNNEQ